MSKIREEYVGIALAFLTIAGCSQPTDSKASQDSPKQSITELQPSEGIKDTISQSPGYRFELAVSQDGKLPDAESAIKVDGQLSRISRLVNATPERIANMAFVGINELKSKGIKVKPYEILQVIETSLLMQHGSFDLTKNGQDVIAETVAAYCVIRTTDRQSHEEAMNSLIEINRLGLQKQ